MQESPAVGICTFRTACGVVMLVMGGAGIRILFLMFIGVSMSTASQYVASMALTTTSSQQRPPSSGTLLICGHLPSAGRFREDDEGVHAGHYVGFAVCAGQMCRCSIASWRRRVHVVIVTC